MNYYYYYDRDKFSVTSRVCIIIKLQYNTLFLSFQQQIYDE